MKLREISCLVAAALLLGACGKKDVAKSPDAPASVAEALAEIPAETVPPAPKPVPSVPALSPEERAAKLGFVGHLPQDTGVVMSFYQVNRSLNRIKSSKLWGLADLPSGANQGDAASSGPAALFNKEFTIALGKPVGEQTGNLLTLNRRMSYLQMRGLAKALAQAARAGDSRQDAHHAARPGYGIGPTCTCTEVHA